MNHPHRTAPEKPAQPATVKAVRGGVYRWIGRVTDAVAALSPLWLRRRLEPLFDHLDMIFIDHGIFRLFYINGHRISDTAWRSAQPWPHQIRRFARRQGIRTIVNLRGVRDCGSFRLEARACEKAGIVLNNELALYSRSAPSRATILGFADFFRSLDYPILVHCKSGADRAGLAGVLYLHLVEDVPIDEALSQLSLRYGHVRQASTGVLDYVFQRYLDYRKDHDATFLEWVETVYDPDALTASFKSGHWANVLVDRVLRRE